MRNHVVINKQMAASTAGRRSYPLYGEDKSDESPASNLENAASCLTNKLPSPAGQGLKNFKMLGKKTIAMNRLFDDSQKAEQEAIVRAHRIDMAIYAIFMFFFTLNTIDGLGDPSPFAFTNRLVSTLGFTKFHLITDVAGLETWIGDLFLDGIYSPNFEAAGSETGPVDPELTVGASSGWVMQGPVRIAQLRSKTYNCKADMHSFVKSFPYRCTHSRKLTYFNSEFDVDTEDTDSFRGFDFDSLEHVPAVDYQRKSMLYSSFETPARHTFPAPAYAVLVDSHQAKATARAQIEGLVTNRYLDRHTNALFIDLSVYNYEVDVTTWVRVSAEFNAGGGVDCRYTLLPVQLLWNPSIYSYKFTMSFFVGLGYFYFGSNLVFRVYKEGVNSLLGEVMTYITIVNIVLYVAQLSYRYQAQSLCVGGFLSDYSIGSVDFLGSDFIDFRGPVRAMGLSVTLQSMNTFLNWFKLVGYLARYPVFALMTRTLECAVEELSAFAVVFVIVMFGFAQAHSMFFGKQLANYGTISDSFLTLFRAMLGDFDFSETYRVNYIIGPLYFITFVGVAFLVVLNIIIAIIADAYVDANQSRKVVLNKKRLIKQARSKDKMEKLRLRRLDRGGSKKSFSSFRLHFDPEKKASLAAVHPQSEDAVAYVSKHTGHQQAIRQEQQRDRSLVVPQEASLVGERPTTEKDTPLVGTWAPNDVNWTPPPNQARTGLTPPLQIDIPPPEVLILRHMSLEEEASLM